MKTVILGDSFAQSYRDTWFELVSKKLSLNIKLQKGFSGGCEFFIYEEFINFLKKQTCELVIFCHTEPQRLANPDKIGINANTAFQLSSTLPQQLISAAQAYYTHLYYEPFHNTIHNLLIQDLQNICLKQNIKQIHFRSFNHPVSMLHGMWLQEDLHSIAAKSSPDYFQNYSLRNHFTPQQHQQFAYEVLPLMQEYINGNFDCKVYTLTNSI